MSRCRMWEWGAAAALLLTVGLAAQGVLRPLLLNRAMERALEKGNWEAARDLVRRGASVHVRSGDGMTFLSTASWRGDLDAIRTALDRGADVETPIPWRHCGLSPTPDGYLTPLAVAVEGRQVGAVRLLLARGANPNVKGRYGNWTLLTYAETRGLREIAELLRDAGASPAGVRTLALEG